MVFDFIFGALEGVFDAIGSGLDYCGDGLHYGADSLGNFGHSVVYYPVDYVGQSLEAIFDWPYELFNGK